MKGANARALAEELAPVIGAEAARRLLAAFAGREVYVPRRASGHHPIAVAIGEEKAALFCEHWHGTKLEFPVEITKRRAVLDLKAAGRSNGMIATELMVSQRFVRMVLAEQADKENRQLRLFG